jgi:hypothetical protein
MRQRLGKALGADPSPLIHYQVETFLQTLLLPNLPSFPTKRGKVFDEVNWVVVWLIAPRLNVMSPITSIITYGIVSARAPCAFDLFQCGYPQHLMWPKATKSILNPPAAPIDKGKSFILFLISNASIPSGNEGCKRYANLFGAESGCVMRTDRK